MKHLIIVNPAAGKEKAAQKVLPYLQQALQSSHIEYETALTKYPGHGTELARKAAATGPVRIYACGGDGTLAEVLEAVRDAGPTAEVAHIPCGSGNDFVRNFGTLEEFLDMGGLLAGQAVPIDLIQTGEGRVAASICSIGLDAKVAYGIPMFRRLPLCGGSMAYQLSIVKCLLQPLGSSLTIDIDGTRLEGKFLLACIANGRFYGGGYEGAPTARLDDGILELVTIDQVSRFRIASLLSRYKRGEHFSQQQVASQFQGFIRHYRGKSISIQGPKPFIANRDGECGPRTEMSLHILPSAARFVLPQAVYTRYTQPNSSREPAACTL